MAKEKVRSSKEVTESLFRGLNEMLEASKDLGKSTLTKRVRSLTPVPEFKAVEVKKIRAKLSLTQRGFANALGVSLKTVESWEANRNKPNGTAQRFLYLLDKNPKLLEEIEN